MSCYPPGSFTHSLLLSQNTPCNRSLIVVASRQGMQMLTRCCQSGKWGGKRSLSCYKHDRAWSAATGVSRRTSLCFMAAVLTDKGLSSAENSHNDLKKNSMKCGFIFHFSGSGNASSNLSCCVQQEMPLQSRAGVAMLGSSTGPQMAPERLCSV